ncbi:hypothetical protein ACPPVW_04870 [Leifsonia sp. McL0607]|uniref:hypothetical protein n=1 Tax=Leifsonia sp. McL0607 TaxID=3415672 RepID=UPI003CF5BD88
MTPIAWTLTGESGLVESVSSWDPFALPEVEKLDAVLRKLYDRRAVIALPPLSPAAFDEILVINNAAESIFLGLREAERFGDLTRLEHRRRAFYASPDDDRTFEQLLVAARFEEPRERARRELARQLRGKQSVDDHCASAQIDELLAVASRLRTDQRSLVDRLTVVSTDTSPSDVYRSLIATIQSNETRRKLGKAWTDVAGRHYARLADSLLAAKDSKPEAGASPGYRETATMLRDFLRLARCDAEDHLRDLAGQDGGRPDTGDAVHIDLPHLVHTKLAARPPAAYGVADVLRFVSFIVEQLFGMTIVFAPLSHGVFSCRIESDGLHVATAYVDLNDRASKPYRASYTQPIRNTVATRKWAVSAYSYISCRALSAEQGKTVSFQSIISLLHELGHAIQHALPKHPLPNLSGLEGATSGRSESFSLWLEKGAFVLDGLAEQNGIASLGRERMMNAATQRLTAFSRGAYALIEFAFDYGSREDLADVLGGLESSRSGYVQLEVVEAMGELADRLRHRRPGDNFRYIQAGVESTSAITVSTSDLRAGGRILSLRPWQPGHDVLGHPAEYFRFYRMY